MAAYATIRGTIRTNDGTDPRSFFTIRVSRVDAALRNADDVYLPRIQPDYSWNQIVSFIGNSDQFDVEVVDGKTGFQYKNTNGPTDGRWVVTTTVGSVSVVNMQVNNLLVTMPDVPATPTGYLPSDDRNYLPFPGLHPYWSHYTTADTTNAAHWIASGIDYLDTRGGFYTHFKYVQKKFLDKGVINTNVLTRPNYSVIDSEGQSIISGSRAHLDHSSDGGWLIHYYTDFRTAAGNTYSSNVNTAYVLIDRLPPPAPVAVTSGEIGIYAADYVLVSSGAYVRTNITEKLPDWADEPMPNYLEWRFKVDSEVKDWVRMGPIGSHTAYFRENSYHPVQCAVRDLKGNASDYNDEFVIFVPPHRPKKVYRLATPSGSIGSYDLHVKFNSPERFFNDTHGSSAYLLDRYQDGILSVSYTIPVPTNKVVPIQIIDRIIPYNSAITYTWKYYYRDSTGTDGLPLDIPLDDGNLTPPATPPDGPGGDSQFSYEKSITVPAEYSARRRWGVGVEDIKLEKKVYVATGTLISKPYYAADGIYKVSLRTEEVVTDAANTIDYYVSVDGGSVWTPIQPENRIFSSNLPYTITYNSLLSPEQRASSPWGLKAFVDVDGNPKKVQLRAVFRRGTNTYETPQLLRYQVKVITRKSQWNLTSPFGFLGEITWQERNVRSEL